MNFQASSPGSPVVILGMARSGTSATTRLLALLGVELGPEQALLRPIEGENAKGFFEHKGIMRVNKDLLERAGGSWSDPPRLPGGWQEERSLEDLRERARELIASDFAGASLWGFKDPRTSLTLPFWDGLLGDARFVVCHRPPLDSARSLERRNGIRLDDGVALWTHYTASALAHTHERSRVIVGYEQLFSERDALVEELARFLGVPERAADPQVRAAVADWVESDLRHHAASLREQMEHPAVSAEARALYLLTDRAIAARNTKEAVGLQDALDGMALALLRHHAARGSLARQGLEGILRNPPEARSGLSQAPPNSRPNGASPQTHKASERPAAAETAAPTPAAGSPGTQASIIVVLADDPWGGMACLESICELEPNSPKHEIVLVDNASRGLGATIRALRGDVRVVHLPERLETMQALRAGIEASEGEIVVLLPAPALLAGDALSALCVAVNTQTLATDVSAAGGVGETQRRMAVVSVDPSAPSNHPTTARAIALRRGSVRIPEPTGLGAEQVIGALCVELSEHGTVKVCTAAQITPPRASLCRRGPGREEIEVSVVIPTLDVASFEVRDCVRAIQATIRAPHEIILVDNGAPPQGFTAPVNAALRAARGERLVVINDDVRVLDGWWEPLADALERGAQVVFPLTVEGRMRWEFAAWCFAMRREVLESMSCAPGEFFDPTMVIWCQDADLRKRMTALGAPPLCVPESRVRHVGSRTVRVNAPHHALRSWIHAQAAHDTAVFRARYPQETSAREREGLPSGLPILTPEHVEISLTEDVITIRAEGPRWQVSALDWPPATGHFFLAGEIEVRAADSVEDILVRAMFVGEDERELFWIDLVPGVIGTGRLAFNIPRERARPIRSTGDEIDPEWSAVRAVRFCGRSRLRGVLVRDPAAAGATVATLSQLHLLAAPAEVSAL